MRVRVPTTTTAVFGCALWGLPHIGIPVVAGSVVTADRIEVTPECIYAASPFYVERPDGSVTVNEWAVRHDPLPEQPLDENGRQAFRAFTEGMGIEDLPLPPP